MKTLSIRQPWASLTAAGIRNIDLQNRDTKYRGRILLHASGRRVGSSFAQGIDTERLCLLLNAQSIGLVPYNEEVALSSVIGMADLTDCTTTPPDSVWAGESINWVLANVQLFDTPIPDIQGKQGLFDIESITEQSLPSAHAPFSPESWIEGDTFHLTMSDVEIDRQRPELPLVLLVCSDQLAAPLIPYSTPYSEGSSCSHAAQTAAPDGLPPISNLTLHSPTRTATLPIHHIGHQRELFHDHEVEYIFLQIGQ